MCCGEPPAAPMVKWVLLLWVLWAVASLIAIMSIEY